jgi:hypothetical protein
VEKTQLIPVILQEAGGTSAGCLLFQEDYMTYHSEHARMKPVLDTARLFDIATNLDPQAIFDAGSGGFQIWCTPDNHPRGWEGIQLDAGAFSKPCGFVASARWDWGVDHKAEQITHLALSTSAYDLADQKPRQFSQYNDTEARRSRKPTPIQNRPADITWAKKKIYWLFTQAGVPCPPIVVEQGG